MKQSTFDKAIGATKPRDGEVFTQRFIVARSKDGAGYVAAIHSAQRISFTPHLPEAFRFGTKNEFVDALEKGIEDARLVGVRDARRYHLLGCTAEIRIGSKRKDKPS